MQKIKILIVDDSAFMRKSLSIMLSTEEDFEIVGTAHDGLEGYEMAKRLKPDIITLDIEMPKMDGLTSLKKIMQDCPTSVIMVSSLTTEGAESTIKALELGAVDFIPKEMSYVSFNITNIKADLIKKIKSIVREKLLRKRLSKISNITGTKERKEKPIVYQNKDLKHLGFRAVILGISTGGPLALQKVIPRLEKNSPYPIFIVQHMPPKFTKSLADRLNNLSEIEVKEAEDNEIIKNGTVYLAPGGFHMKFKSHGTGLAKIKIDEKPDNTLHRPSVDIMFESAIELYGKKLLGIIMTGMGKDGLESVKKLKAKGGSTIIQERSSCVVYGMPRAVEESGLADIIVPLEDIAHTIRKVY